MTLRPFFRRAARLEYDEAAGWYESQRLGLGIEFVSEIERALLQACEMPQRFPRMLADVRCVRVRRFPYSIFFRIAGLQYDDVVKLLTLIDHENSISRGSLGQSIEALISSMPNSGEVLREVVHSPELDPFVRECAALIVAMHEGPEALPLLAHLAKSGSWYASEMVTHLKEWGHINPYA